MESLAKWIPGCSKYFGGESQQKLIFVPDADNKPEEDHEISEPALFRFLLNEETLIELDEAEAEIPEMLKVLKDVEKGSKITEFETHQSSISMLKDFKRAFHVFVVFKTTCKTDGNYWWSLEKNRDYIALQRSRNKNNVKDKCYGEPRNQVKPIVENLDGKGTIQDLFAVLWAHQIIPGKYNIFKSNCQSFVTFVSQEITQEEYKYKGYFPYSPPPDSGRDQKMLDLINIFKGCSNFPPLLTVILMGNTDLVDKIVASGKYDINASYHGLTPLEFAIFSSRTKMAKHLLKDPLNADPTTQNESGMNALQLAAMSTTKTEIFDLLLEHDKVKVNDVDENGETALHFAAFTSNVIAVEKLIEKGANPNVLNKQGASPLHVAAQERDGCPIIDLLLEDKKVKGMGDVNDRDVHGMTALHYAASTSNEITAEHLFKKGAGIHYRDENGQTPLHTAALCAKDIEFIDLLLRNIKDGGTRQFRNDERLFLYVMSNVNGLEVEIGDRLVKKGIKPPCSTKTDDCLTAESDKAKGVNTRRFVDEGTDPSTDLIRFYGRRMAGAKNPKEIEEILKEKKFDINGRDQNGKTLLFLAICANNVNAVKILLEKGADPTIRNNNGRIPFFAAAIVDRDCHILNLLLESGKVDINETTSQQGSTALHMAIVRSNVTAVRFLLSKGANPNVADKNGATPLHLAVMFAKDMDIVELLLNHKDTDVNCLDKFGINALDFAYKFNAQGHGERIANLLKEKGAVETQIKQNKGNIESMKNHMHDYSNRKPCEEENVISDDAIPIKDKIAKISKDYLVKAIQNSNIETLRLLLNNGADISSARGEDGENALHVASRYAKTTDIIDVILETGKFNINEVDNDGNTPLYYAISGTNRESNARHLIQKGADPTIADEEGNTPLHLAARYVIEIETIKLILENQQVDIDLINKEGETALYYAIRAKNVEIVRCLLEKGADPTVRDEDGFTPFQMAAAFLADTDILGFMLANEKKINIDEKDKKGSTALHMATFASNVTAVRFLLSKGANPNVADENGVTPLHLAASCAKDMDLIEVLLNNKDTNVNYLDNKGNKALQYAMRNKHGLGEEIANLLREKRATKAEGNNHKSKKVAASVPAGRIKEDSDNIKTIRLLIENGQDVSAMTWGENGANALHLAAAGEETTDLIDVILETGKFDINGVDNDGLTPLHYAIKRPKPITINSRRLIKMGANPSVPDKNGVTPLHMAARNAESMDLIEILLNAEAVDVNHYDHNGTTPLAYARANKHGLGQRIIARLKKYDDEKK